MQSISKFYNKNSMLILVLVGIVTGLFGYFTNDFITSIFLICICLFEAFVNFQLKKYYGVIFDLLIVILLGIYII